jgi:hypothetical protein
MKKNITSFIKKIVTNPSDFLVAKNTQKYNDM